MKEKVTVDFTPLQAVILWRLFNQDTKCTEELLKTEQFKYVMNGKSPDNKHSPVSCIKEEALEQFIVNPFFGLFDDALNYMGINPKTYLEPTIRIGDHKVQFVNDGIRVGCQFVSNEQLKEIMERQKIVVDKDDAKS